MARKGQAAMEFLMTYGWAIMAVLVMIGALAYFGVMNPSRFTPDKCLFGSGITCKDYRIMPGAGSTVTLDLSLENKLGETIRVQRISASNVAGCTLSPAANTAIPADGTFSATCTGITISSNTAGQLAKSNVTITYQVLSGIYNRTITGEVSTKIQ